MNYCRRDDDYAKKHHAKLDNAYRHLLHSVARVERNHNVGLDQQGVDVSIVFDRGTIHLDEKIRRKYYGDFLVEVSDDSQRYGTRPGWATDPDKITDVVAYVVPDFPGDPSSGGRVWFVNYPALRCVTLAEFQHRPRVAAPNPTHTTWNVSVKWKDLSKHQVPFVETRF